MRVCSLSFLLLFAGVAIADDRPPPKYEGKSLDYWVGKLENPTDNKERDLATQALCSFGKDAAPAVPKLLEMIEDKSDEYRRCVSWVFQSIGPAAKAAVPTVVKRLENDTATDPNRLIGVLADIGPGAKEAVPVLVKLTMKPETRHRAVEALCAIGPDAAKEGVPAILAAIRANPKLLNDYLSPGPEAFKSTIAPGLAELLDDTPDGVDRRRVILLLERIGRDAKAAVPTLKKMLPTVGQLEAERRDFEKYGRSVLTDNPERLDKERRDRQLSFWAAEALAKIEPCKEALPALVVEVQTKGAINAAFVAELLGGMGEVAAEAVPVLKEKLVAVEDEQVKKIYHDAIKAIEGKRK